MSFDVELAVAPGLGKNHKAICNAATVADELIGSRAGRVAVRTILGRVDLFPAQSILQISSFPVVSLHLPARDISYIKQGKTT
ncbi:MAG TPA: hypothetical protein ACFCUC_15890 [Desulfobacterales bacterium]